MNSCNFTGRLTKDPELSTTTNGVEYCNFRLAVDRRYKKDGQQNVDFIDFKAWRQTAVFLERYFNKGKMVAVQGSLCVEDYTDRDGNKRKSVYIAVDNVEFCGGNSNSTETRQPAEPAQDTSMDIANDDELPF